MSRPAQRYFGVGQHDFKRADNGTAFFVYASADLVVHDWDWIDFLKELKGAGIAVPKTPSDYLDLQEAENLYCAATFQVEL